MRYLKLVTRAKLKSKPPKLKPRKERGSEVTSLYRTRSLNIENLELFYSKPWRTSGIGMAAQGERSILLSDLCFIMFLL
jgi:hypothetical protein